MTAGAGRPRRTRRLALGVLVAAVVALALRAALWRPLPLAGEAPQDGYARLSGVVHVHTTFSDGGGGPEEVATAARTAGLGFVFVTDHNNLDAKPFEGYHGGVLVGVGTEISTTSGHLVALGLPDPALRFWGDPEAALDDVRTLGGVAFVAHPHSPRADFRWTRWDLPGSWGLEAFNGDSQWRSAAAWRLLRALGTYPFNRTYALLGSLGSNAETLAQWDSLLARRDVAMLTGADAHSRVPVWRDRGERARDGLRFPAYDALFGVARNHVLLDRPPGGDAARDLADVVAALARGRSYAGLDGLAPAGGFSFVAERAGRRFTMGATLPPAPDLRLLAGGRLPRGARLVLLRDGHPVVEEPRQVDFVASQPGVYRVEVRVPGFPLPWVVSNPIYVFDAAAAEARRRAADGPLEAEAPGPASMLDDFEHDAALHPEADPASELSLTPETGAGLDGRAAGRVSFQLALPGPAGPAHTWCALVNREARDLSRFRGVTLAVKADGVYRLWLQLRDVNPKGSDDGLETWLTSIRTSGEWRRVAVPFARLRSLDPRSDGGFDPTQVRVLALVLDELTVKAGTRGTLYLDEVGFY